MVNKLMKRCSPVGLKLKGQTIPSVDKDAEKPAQNGC